MRSQATFSAMLWMVGLIVVGGVSMHPAQVRAQGTRWEHYMAEGAKAYQDGQETNAEMFYLAALEDVQNAGPEDPRLAATLNTLAVLYHTQKKYAQAESLYQRALAIDEQVLGPLHPSTAIDLNNLAELYHDQSKFELAEPLLQRAGQGSEHAPGVIQPDPEDPGSAKAREGSEASETRPGRLRGGRRLLDDAGHLGEALLGRGTEELERDVPGLPGGPPGPRNRHRGNRLLHRVLLRLGDLEGDEEAQHQPGSPSSHSRSWLSA